MTTRPWRWRERFRPRITTVIACWFLAGAFAHASHAVENTGDLFAVLLLAVGVHLLLFYPYHRALPRMTDPPLHCHACAGRFTLHWDEARERFVVRHSTPFCAAFDALETSVDALRFADRCLTTSRND